MKKKVTYFLISAVIVMLLMFGIGVIRYNIFIESSNACFDYQNCEDKELEDTDKDFEDTEREILTALEDQDTPLASYMITPEMFGACGDGVTDDGVAFEQALQNAIQNNRIFYLTKNYFIGDGNNRIDCQMRDVQIVGAKGSSIIISPSSSSTNAIYLTNASEVSISGVTVVSEMNKYDAVPPGSHSSNGALSSNVRAFNIRNSESVFISDSMAIGCAFFGFFQMKQYNGTEHGRIQVINSRSLDGGGMGIYADNFGMLTVDGFELTRVDNICGGMHVIYTSEYWGGINVNNVKYISNNDDFDYTVFNFRNAHDILYVCGDASVTNSVIKCSAPLLSIRNDFVNVSLKNVTYVGTDNSTSIASIVTSDTNGKIQFDNCKIYNSNIASCTGKKGCNYSIEIKNSYLENSPYTISGTSAPDLLMDNCEWISEDATVASSPFRAYGNRKTSDGVSISLLDCQIKAENYYAPVSDKIESLVIEGCEFIMGESTSKKTIISKNEYLIEKVSVDNNSIE